MSHSKLDLIIFRKSVIFQGNLLLSRHCLKTVSLSCSLSAVMTRLAEEIDSGRKRLAVQAGNSGISTNITRWGFQALWGIASTQKVSKFNI